MSRSKFQNLSRWLFRLDAEQSHRLVLNALAMPGAATLTRALLPPAVEDPVELMGLRFRNRVGLAAGLDKDGEAVSALAAFGFSALELGTVTPRPQSGNPRPRLFRLPAEQAIINRMGFNNRGAAALVRRLQRREEQPLLGINIGKNKTTSNRDAVDDYLTALRIVTPVADYITINLSSPNTPGLRDLQQEDELRRLLEALATESERLRGVDGRRVPLVVKIAPDLDDQGLEQLATVVLEGSVDGVIATNTTLSRSGVEASPCAAEAGGLSGRPLFELATATVARLHTLLGGRLPIIAAGGIDSSETALAKLDAGASMVQLYSGLIYRGPGLVHEVASAIAARSQSNLE